MELYDTLPEAVLVLDGDRTVVAWNDRATAMLGLDDGAVGAHVGDALTLRTTDGTLCRDPVPARGIGARLAEQRFHVQLADGRTRPVVLAGRWQPDGGVVLTFRAAGRRAAGDTRQADLVATVSHELRSPLTSVRGFTRTLLQGWERYTDEQKRTMLATMHEDAERVTRLLSELLATARIDAHRVQLHVSGIDPGLLVQAVVDKALQRPDGEGRDLRVAVASDAPRLVFADADKVEQILTNLVDNALRHAPDATVELAVGSDGDGGVRVDVRDDGPGVPADQQRTVFEKFARGRASRADGSGLGLYISRGLAREHGGDVRMTSVPGEGATFTLELPSGAAPG